MDNPKKSMSNQQATPEAAGFASLQANNQPDQKIDHITKGFSSMRVNAKTRIINFVVTLFYLVPSIIGLVLMIFLGFFLFSTGNYISGIIVIGLEILFFSWIIGLALAQSKIIELHDAFEVKISFGHVLSLALHRSIAMTSLIILRAIYFLPRYSLAPYFLVDQGMNPRHCLEMSAAIIENKSFGKQYAAVTAESLAIQMLTRSSISSSAAANSLAKKYVEFVAAQ